MSDKCIFIYIALYLLSFSPFSISHAKASLIEYHAPKDSAEVHRLINLSRSYKNTESTLEDIEHASNAVDIAFKSKDINLYAKSLDNLGLIYRYKQQYQEALPLHIKAFELIKDSTTTPLQQMIYANNAGLAARYHEEYKVATEYYLKALSIAEQNENLKNISISCNGLGITYMNIPGMESKALQYLFRSLEIAKSQNNSVGTAMNYISISEYYIRKERFDSTRYYLHELIDINTQLGDQFGKAMTLQSLGNSIIKENKNIGKAETYLLESKLIFDTLNRKRHVASVLNDLGNLYFKKSEFQKSLKQHLHSFRISQEMNLRNLIITNANSLSSIYERLKRYESALIYNRIASAYSDSLKLDNQKIEVAIIDRKYDLANKEQEIQILQKDKELQNSLIEIQNQRVKNRGIIIVLLIFFFVAFAAFLIVKSVNKSKSRQIAEVLQQSENEKIKANYEKTVLQSEVLAQQMRMNPHMIFNCLNAIIYLIQSEAYQKAQSYILHLSRYIRLTLETSSTPTASLEEELELIRHYLKLESIRFVDEFEFKVIDKLDCDLRSRIQIPTLILQPYVENAIWHGLLPKINGPKVVTVCLEKHNNTKVRVTIDDNGVGRDKSLSEKKNQKHISMGNKINSQRIKLFNQNHNMQMSVNIIDKKDENRLPIGTTVVISIETSLDEAGSTAL